MPGSRWTTRNRAIRATPWVPRTLVAISKRIRTFEDRPLIRAAKGEGVFRHGGIALTSFLASPPSRGEVGKDGDEGSDTEHSPRLVTMRDARGWIRWVCDRMCGPRLGYGW